MDTATGIRGQNRFLTSKDSKDHGNDLDRKTAAADMKPYLDFDGYKRFDTNLKTRDIRPVEVEDLKKAGYIYDYRLFIDGFRSPNPSSHNALLSTAIEYERPRATTTLCQYLNINENSTFALFMAIKNGFYKTAEHMLALGVNPMNCCNHSPNIFRKFSKSTGKR